MSTPLWLGSLALAAVIGGCAGGPLPQETYGGDPQSDDAERGAVAYAHVCAPCHEDPNNERAPLLADVHMPPWAIRQQVREGDLWMTAIPLRRMSEGDLEALLAFFTRTGTCVIDDDRWGTAGQEIPAAVSPATPRIERTPGGLDAGAMATSQ